jgi:hypothetical protein
MMIDCMMIDCYKFENASKVRTLRHAFAEQNL